jgi:hypothetical protein
MLGALIGAAAGLGGTLLTNRAQEKAAGKQMDYQLYMSNTAYQRAAKDLEKAGLNRVLALGSPASTPAGAQPAYQNLASGLTAGVNSAIALKDMNATVKMKKAQLGPLNLEKEISDEALKFLNKPSNEKYKEAYLGAMLAKKAGLPSWSGLIPAGESAANSLKWHTPKMNQETLNQLKKDAQKRKEAYYQEDSSGRSEYDRRNDWIYNPKNKSDRPMKW